MDYMNHIEIQRQTKTYSYRGRQYPTAPHPPVRNRNEHGKKLRQELTDAKETISSARRKSGIETDKLMVLELSSCDALSNDLLETFLTKLNLSLVEEIKISENEEKLLIQFETEQDIQKFEEERKLWELDELEDGCLTYAKRRDIFNCINSIRTVEPKDRLGKKLRHLYDSKKLPDGYFVVDIDVWYDNDKSDAVFVEGAIRKTIGTNKQGFLTDLFEISGMLLGRAKVNIFSLNALMNLDIVACIELPQVSSYSEPDELYSKNVMPIFDNSLSIDSPMAAVLDTGVFSGNRLLENVVVADKDFDNTEGTTSDLNGHGTAVAGIVAYGDIPSCISTKLFTPLVRICNGKIMHNQKDFLDNNHPVFSETVRPEKIVSDAIRSLHEEYGCRVFNLSAGNDEEVFNGGRQFPWASMLDKLCRELDIVIVVSVGNNQFPPLPIEITSRDDIKEKVRDCLFEPDNKVINPATAAIAVTVGSISRYATPALSRNIENISVGNQDYPSAFTRIGKGINKSIKPEFVAYGGNFSLKQIVRGKNNWNNRDVMLMEPSLSNDGSNIFKAFCGTSFAAPYVTHIAARIEKSLKDQLHEKPSANLVRALLANSASCTTEMVQWGESSTDKNYTGKDNPKHARMMQLFGYGKVSDRLIHSSSNCVTLFAEDKIEMKDFHLYQIPVPEKFLKVKADKSITISMAYDPVTLLSRKDYIADILWMEVFRRIDEETLVKYKAKKEAEVDTQEDLTKMPNCYKAGFTPGFTEVQTSTLQQRKWFKSRQGGSDLLWKGEKSPYIYILVSGKSRYRHPEQGLSQKYALCITFEYSSEEEIQLYELLKDNVHLKVREQERDRVRAKVRLT